MKRLPKWNRRQKTLRNLLVTGSLVFLLWFANDFAAPTLDLAVKWEGQQYFLKSPEVLGVFSREQGRDSDVLIRDGDVFASAVCRKRFLCFRELLGLQFTEAVEGPVAFFQQQDVFDVTAVYAYANLEGDVRAVCDLRLRSDIEVTISGDGQYAHQHFDWDETYSMEAEPDENGVYQFALQRKYPQDPQASYQEQTWSTAERGTLLSFQSVPRHSAGSDFACDVTVTFYDQAGGVLYTFQKELWNTLEPTGGEGR